LIALPVGCLIKAACVFSCPLVSLTRATAMQLVLMTSLHGRSSRVSMYVGAQYHVDGESLADLLTKRLQLRRRRCRTSRWMLGLTPAQSRNMSTLMAYVGRSFVSVICMDIRQTRQLPGYSMATLLRRRRRMLLMS